MTAEELDLVETDDLFEALRRRSKHFAAIVHLDRGGPGKDNLRWSWDGEHLYLFGLLRRLDEDIMASYREEAEKEDEDA